MAHRYTAEAEKLKLMLYGQPGSGKTWLAATASEDPRLGRCLMLESFGNPVSLKGKKHIPDIITIEDIKDFKEVIKEI